MIASREKREINRNDHLIGSKPQAQPNLVLKVPCKGAGDNRPFVAEDNTLIERSAQRDYGDDRICAAQGSGEFLQANINRRRATETSLTVSLYARSGRVIPLASDIEKPSTSSPFLAGNMGK